MLRFAALCLVFASANCIFNADEISWSRHGYIVKVLARELRGKNTTTCTGSLVSPAAVLTSSKCFPNYPESDYEAMAIVQMPGSNATMHRAMLDLRVDEDIAMMRIDRIRKNLCEPSPAPPRIARLNVKSSLLEPMWQAVDRDELTEKPCRLLGFQTVGDNEDFVKGKKAMMVPVELKKDEEDNIMFANVEDGGSACWDDVGAPLVCALNEEDKFVQVGMLHSIYAEAPNEDWDTNNATCTDVKTMRFSVFVDDTVAEAAQAVDKIGLLAAYDKCGFH